MKKNKAPIVARKFAVFTLALSLCCGIVIADKNIFGGRVHAGSAKNAGRDGASKKFSSDLRGKKGGDTPVNVILQLNGKPSGQLNALLNRNDVHLRGSFRNFNAMAVELPERVVEELAAFEEVAYVSPDRETQTLGHVSRTTGADAVRQHTNALGVSYTLNGSGVGIAILDSGIDAQHKAFVGDDGRVRVAVSRDFTGENRTDDPYGHGTHVASIAAGNGRISNARYVGIAPNANIINLRVLNSQGVGTVSGLLAALDWLMTNRVLYNIRVANLSLGMPAVDSYRDDPVCKAVRRLVDAGVVVAAAAGNNGKDASGRKVYGAIHAPGNEPSAITVGASNTLGSDARGDDTIATYSSRGPTRSSWVDTDGVRHYDNLIKPDLVAPGNKIVGAEAQNNLLVGRNPQLDAGVSFLSNRRQMYLNGTSMSTPAVAGAAALLLQVHPKLTPNMVKSLLMYTAQPLKGFNMLEQGAGQLNIEGAVRLAKLVRTDLTSATALGAPMLTTSTLPTPRTTIAGITFNWSQGLILNSAYAKGTELITKYQKIYGLGVVIGDGALLGDGVVIGDNQLLTMGVVIGDRIMTSDGVVIGDGTVFAEGVVIGDGALLGDGVVIGDGSLLGDGVVVGDGVVIGDAPLLLEFIMQAQSASEGGDDTPSMPIEVDTGVDYLDCQ